jgi:hypothetical protein
VSDAVVLYEGVPVGEEVGLRKSTHLCNQMRKIGKSTHVCNNVV